MAQSRAVSDAGILFYRNSGPRPGSLNEVPEFLRSYAVGKQSPGERVLERMGKSASRTSGRSQGRLKRLTTGGKPEFELAGRELGSWMRLLVHDGHEWVKGTFRFTGDGGKVVEPHVNGRTEENFVGPQTVLRWPDKGRTSLCSGLP